MVIIVLIIISPETLRIVYNLWSWSESSKTHTTVGSGGQLETDLQHLPRSSTGPWPAPDLRPLHNAISKLTDLDKQDGGHRESTL